MKFYHFRSNNEKNCIRIKPKAKYDTQNIIEKDNILVDKNEFIKVSGKKLFDILQFDDSLNIAISRPLKELLEKNKITGWSCFPIVIEGVENDYFCFQNLSKAGPILNLEAVNNYETEYIEFDTETWDGSDVFNLQNTLLNVCTASVKELFESAKITNILIQDL